MTRETLAKLFGATIRDEVPEVTWECLPAPMLKLLLEIAEAEISPRHNEECDCADSDRETSR